MLSVVGIFWNTHRGAIQVQSLIRFYVALILRLLFLRSLLPILARIFMSRELECGVEVASVYCLLRMPLQGNGLSKEKLQAMIGMFHDGGDRTILAGNVAAGSERAGFSGPGVSCNVSSAPAAINEAHACLSGYWFDFYGVADRACVRLAGFTAWRVYLYGVYGELPTVRRAELAGVTVADTAVGIRMAMIGSESLNHDRVEKRVVVTDSLLVGSSTGGTAPDGGAGGCGLGSMPSLHTCDFYMAYCNHLNGQV